MHRDNESYGSSPSTTWVSRRVKMRSAPQASTTARRSRSKLASLPPWPPRRKLTVQVTYRGGPECWWELEARGVVIRRPGVTALHDVLREIERFD